MSSLFRGTASRLLVAFSCIWAVVVEAAIGQDRLPEATEEATTEHAPTPGHSGSTIKSRGAGISKKDLSRPAREAGHPAGPASTQRIAQAPRRSRSDNIQAPSGLPNDAGQIWQTYNIRPYTLRVTSTNRPEQSVIDWVLRETGYETWHSETCALLYADQSTLTAYHTPEVQAVVEEIVERFVSSEAETHAFGLRVITMGSPSWRSKFQALLHPVPTQTQGIHAWLVHREDAALLLSELSKRSDYREHSSPHLLVNNGQSTTVSAIRPRPYVKDLIKRPERIPSFEPDHAQFDEGFSLEFSPLLTLDGRYTDAVIKCNIDQLEKLVRVSVPVGNAVNPRQQAEVHVPQIAHFGLHERFRWPSDQMLLVGLGVVATPVPGKPNGLPGLTGPPRADLLVLIDARGKVGQTPDASRTGMRDVKSYHGRY